jgi:hypothetical protein
MSPGVRPTAVMILVGLALELAGIATYVLVARSAEVFVLISFALVMLALLGFPVRRLARAGRVLAFFVLSLGPVGVVELLAWTVFPSLRHDMVPFSPWHIRRMMGVALVGFVAIGGSVLVLSILTFDSLLGPSEGPED